MSGHTPGPWEVTPPRRHWAYRVERRGTPIADIVYTGNASEDDANARLIAAAPYMLEALRDIFESSECHQSVARARAAVAKATGGAS